MSNNADVLNSKADDRDSGTESDSGDGNLNIMQDPLYCDMAATCSHFNPHCQSLSFDNHNSDCALVSVDEMWPLRCSNYNASLSSVTYAPVWHGYSVVNSDVNRFNASDVDCCSLLEKVTLTSERAATGLASSQFDAEAVVPSELDRSVSEYGMNYANADDDEVSSLFKSSRQETSECNDSQIVRDFTSQPPALCVRGTVQTISPGCFFAKADERKFLTSLISDTSNYTPLNGRGSAHLLEYCDNMDASVPRPSLNLEKMQRRLLRRGRSSAFRRTTPLRCRLLGSSGHAFE